MEMEQIERKLEKYERSIIVVDGLVL